MNLFWKKKQQPIEKTRSIWKYSFPENYFNYTNTMFESKDYLKEPNHLLSTQELKKPNTMHIYKIEEQGVWWSGIENYKQKFIKKH